LYLQSSFFPEALRRAEESVDDLEEKLKASERARKKAEKDTAGVEDLREDFKPLKMP
jgi:hypothetical protein